MMSCSFCLAFFAAVATEGTKLFLLWLDGVFFDDELFFDDGGLLDAVNTALAASDAAFDSGEVALIER